MPTLLLIDDNPDFRTVFQRKFSEMGYRVITAPDGVRGFQAVMDVPVDLIVLDLNMAYRGGLETLRLIRSVRANVRVIVLSALVDETSQIELQKLGVSEVLLKPLGIKTLAETIRQALGGPA
jgi:DNA-binding response OmpR family regulator